MEIYNLTEIFRKLYPELKGCTWRQNNIWQQAAFALLTIMLQNSYKSDHPTVILQFKLNDFINMK